MQRFKARKTKRELTIIGSSRLSQRKNEPDAIDPAGIQCPLVYSPLETEIWNSYFRLLTMNRTLSASDAAIFDIFVRAYSELTELESYLKTHGKTYKIASGREFSRPEVAIRNDARRELRGLMIQLGLSPASRGHVEKIKNAESLNRWKIT